MCLEGINPFSSPNSCFAESVGRRGGRQPMVLGSGPRCLGLKRRIVQMFLRSLGFYYEHQRPDRDSFVDIYPQNVEGGFAIVEREFGKIPKIDEIWRIYPLYDFNSITHHLPDSFSKNPDEYPTILPKKYTGEWLLTF